MAIGQFYVQNRLIFKRIDVDVRVECGEKAYEKILHASFEKSVFWYGSPKRHITMAVILYYTRVIFSALHSPHAWKMEWAKSH